MVCWSMHAAWTGRSYNEAIHSQLAEARSPQTATSNRCAVAKGPRALGCSRLGHARFVPKTTRGAETATPHMLQPRKLRQQILKQQRTNHMRQKATRVQGH